MSEMSSLLLFKTNAAGKVDYLYQLGTMVVKHSVTMEEARRICGEHPITACDRFPSYPCCVRGNYFFPPLITTEGEWPLKSAEPATVSDNLIDPNEPVVESKPAEEAKPVKPRTPAKPKATKPKGTPRKKVQK